MNETFFHGKLVRLTREEPEFLAQTYGRWGLDSEWLRLMDAGVARMYSEKARKEWFEKNAEPDPGNFFFNVRSLADDKLIGDVGLDGTLWNHGEAFVGIAIGEREYWGRGHGSDAMRLILRFAFKELNLHRVALNVFEYNPRAIRSYEKVGFRHEGRVRGALLREGRRWDVLYMGITKEEWIEPD